MKLTKEDVWGQFSEDYIKISDGMIVARHKEVCPIWGDNLPSKSVTVVCDSEDVEDVIYWLQYVHGGYPITNTKTLENGKVALRSDYQCW